MNNEKAMLDKLIGILIRTEQENRMVYDTAKTEMGEKSELAIKKKGALEEIRNIMDEVGIDWQLKAFYFTFGSDEKFPYKRGQYIVVMARDIREAARKYKAVHPNKEDSSVLNCADYYSQKQWEEEVGQYYIGKEPEEIIE